MYSYVIMRDPAGAIRSLYVAREKEEFFLEFFVVRIFSSKEYHTHENTVFAERHRRARILTNPFGK